MQLNLNIVDSLKLQNFTSAYGQRKNDSLLITGTDIRTNKMYRILLIVGSKLRSSLFILFFFLLILQKKKKKIKLKEEKKKRKTKPKENENENEKQL